MHKIMTWFYLECLNGRNLSCLCNGLGLKATYLLTRHTTHNLAHCNRSICLMQISASLYCCRCNQVGRKCDKLFTAHTQMHTKNQNNVLYIPTYSHEWITYIPRYIHTIMYSGDVPIYVLIALTNLSRYMPTMYNLPIIYNWFCSFWLNVVTSTIHESFRSTNTQVNWWPNMWRFCTVNARAMFFRVQRLKFQL